MVQLVEESDQQVRTMMKKKKKLGGGWQVLCYHSTAALADYMKIFPIVSEARDVMIQPAPFQEVISFAYKWKFGRDMSRLATFEGRLQFCIINENSLQTDTLNIQVQAWPHNTGCHCGPG